MMINDSSSNDSTIKKYFNVVVSVKGGVGKTTFCRALKASYLAKNIPLLAVDTDLSTQQFSDIEGLKTPNQTSGGSLVDPTRNANDLVYDFQRNTESAFKGEGVLRVMLNRNASNLSIQHLDCNGFIEILDIVSREKNFDILMDMGGGSYQEISTIIPNGADFNDYLSSIGYHLRVLIGIDPSQNGLANEIKDILNFFGVSDEIEYLLFSRDNKHPQGSINFIELGENKQIPFLYIPTIPKDTIESINKKRLAFIDVSSKGNLSSAEKYNFNSFIKHFNKLAKELNLSY